MLNQPPYKKQTFFLAGNSSGFTLLEVMVAVAILAITVVSLLGSQSQSIQVAMSSRFNTTASLLAGGKITELQLADFSSLSSNQDSFEEPYDNYYYSLKVWTPSEKEIGIETDENTLKAIQLTITLENDEKYSYSIRALISNSPGGEQE
ncbi:MAG: prepilin-type N-terminal cleavage/methylation domain-containing protein [Desulfobulbaceae bacterium]|nr:prepilin-type N-terminal cleavage/methylation domain-containing protein [Desulfobulbaceae bacterium]